MLAFLLNQTPHWLAAVHSCRRQPRAAAVSGYHAFRLGDQKRTALLPLIAQKEFPPAETVLVVPQIVAIGQAGYAFAPAAFGLLRGYDGADAMGSAPVLVYAAAIQLAEREYACGAAPISSIAPRRATVDRRELKASVQTTARQGHHACVCWLW
ncbi:hypothetical protein ATO67_14005 [Agrobacterium bohemicum]|uniref:Uncharacterized protein n=1 Tax=Agrobacterium bohemicum TaxID=2052828 RepID=A0A135NY99_9HYPH|nr:hypothetical protein ATO67_14005 [Agrobacterium bohemicum]